jgi:sugar O-acyltransferase (sialic acid O-acetyltransferase NeuD family)
MPTELDRVVYILGASAQGRVAAEIFQSSPNPPILYFIDDDSSLWTTSINGISVLGGSEYLDAMESPSVHIALGSPIAKRKVFERLKKQGVTDFASCVHRTAVVSPSAVIGQGVSIGANAIINTNAVIGDFCLINSAAVVEHDTLLEEAVTISPNACIGGRVVIRTGSFIGSGAIVLARVTINKGCIIGMGALVNRNIEAHSLAYGAPAKRVKEITAQFNWANVL